MGGSWRASIDGVESDSGRSPSDYRAGAKKSPNTRSFDAFARPVLDHALVLPVLHLDLVADHDIQ
jgi:hypothetical protein